MSLSTEGNIQCYKKTQLNSHAVKDLTVYFITRFEKVGRTTKKYGRATERDNFDI